MCTIPPPPPPLPPPPQPVDTEQPDDDSPTVCNACHLLGEDPTVCEWAASEPDLRRACVGKRICTDKPPYKYKYKNYKLITQVGPTCGLAALSMLFNGKVSLQEIMLIARRRGFTNNGEMFSCKNMEKLANKMLSIADVSRDDVNISVDRDLYREQTVEDLLNGAALLVAYDADFNHTPTKKNGHRAHWLLVCGVVVVEDPSSSDVSFENNVYVLCQHGKSKYLSAWTLKDLAESNNNLWEFPPKRENDGLVYVVPEGGMGGENGLRGQYVTVKWK